MTPEQEDEAAIRAYTDNHFAALGKRWREVPGAWESDMRLLFKLDIFTEYGKEMLRLLAGDVNKTEQRQRAAADMIEVALADVQRIPHSKRQRLSLFASGGTPTFVNEQDVPEALRILLARDLRLSDLTRVVECFYDAAEAKQPKCAYADCTNVAAPDSAVCREHRGGFVETGEGN